MNSYHNTTLEPAKKEIEYESIAVNQDAEVLEILQETKAKLTPYQVHDLCTSGIELNSVRRSLTNLYNKMIIKKGDLVMERKGRRNHQYYV